MAKSLLDQGWRLPSLRGTFTKNRSPTMNSPYTVSNGFIAYFDIEIP